MQEIYDYLNQNGIPFQEHSHPPVFTAEEADKIYDQLGIVGGKLKNLFLRNKKGDQHYLVILESHKEADLKQLAELIGDWKLGFASPERLTKYLRTTKGAVSPFGLIYDTEKHVKTVIDEDVFRYEKIHFHPNDNTKSLEIASVDLKKFLESLGYEVQYVKI